LASALFQARDSAHQTISGIAQWTLRRRTLRRRDLDCGRRAIRAGADNRSPGDTSSRQRTAAIRGVRAIRAGKPRRQCVGPRHA